VDPTPDDAAAAHRACNQRIPSRADLSEVESSSRHYLENGAIYLSAPLMKAGEAEHPALTPVGFIVTATQLVTVRYEPLKAFDAVGASFQAQPPLSGYEAFVRVLEAVIDREADILEQTGEELETVGRTSSPIRTETAVPRRSCGGCCASSAIAASGWGSCATAWPRSPA
jgi:magnesium transporter